MTVAPTDRGTPYYNEWRIMKSFPLLNFGLGETANLIRESVTDFVAAEIAPLAAEIDRNDKFPYELWRKMGDLGLLGITVPEEYGGTGTSEIRRMLIGRELYAETAE